ncbi:hypothetical protein M9H77_35612 [Catharanthus roseus]|uniref:Uncharacterized protein n=1 Tax=Catharanthus roseus TaxID=4058 RepID=A0ACB9ZTQ9_CATRO|nr:hypothetical protein M9H77_35612 [Catharanthus roseus]
MWVDAGYSRAAAAQTTLTVRHRYSLRVDRGNLKRLTPTKVGDAVAKQPMAKGKVKVVGTISSAYMPSTRNTLVTFLPKQIWQRELKVAQSSLYHNPQDTTLMEVGIESFWLGILPISAAVMYRLTSLSRKFLWGGNYAHIAWKTMCSSKEHGGLGLRDTGSWNDALLECRRIHHVYVKFGLVWDLQVKTDFPSLVKRIIFMKVPFKMPLLAYLGILEVLLIHHLPMISSSPWDKGKSGIYIMYFMINLFHMDCRGMPVSICT